MIAASRFIYYSSYFALAAESGLERARSIFSCTNSISNVDTSTISNSNDINVALKVFSRNIDMAYEYLWSDGQSINHMRDAFIALSNYVKKNSGYSSVDSYLASQGIKVRKSYSQISKIVGHQISALNTGGE